MVKLPILSTREAKSPPIDQSTLNNGTATAYRLNTPAFSGSASITGNSYLSTLQPFFPHERQQSTYWQQRMIMSHSDDISSMSSSRIKRPLPSNSSPVPDSPTRPLPALKGGMFQQPVTLTKGLSCGSNQSAVHTRSDRYLSKDFSYLTMNGTSPTCERPSASRFTGTTIAAHQYPTSDVSETEGMDTGSEGTPGSTMNNSAPRWNKASRHLVSSNTSSGTSLSLQENVPSRIYKISTGLGNGNGSQRGLVGLNNLGNTCFMNSILQCLSNTAPLLEYCMTQRYSQDLNRSSSMHGNLFKAYVDLMEDLWRANRSETAVSPLHFKTQVQKFAPRFVGFSQQDSQEFLRYLLEGLHMDVNRVIKRPRPVTPDYKAEDRLSDQEKADVYWGRYLSIDNSQVVDLFVGQLMSTLECLDCGFKSTTFDPFWDLSLPIPKKPDVTLLDCLKLFISKEDLDGHDRPMCAKCKTRRRCSKHFLIQKFPRILVLHLKRFSGERFRSKMSVLVDYPVANLNLIEFAAPSCQQTFAHYQLYAVSNHSGSVYAGHYTAICRHPYAGTWNEYNDSRVRQVTNHSAVSAEGYVLFYELK